MFQKWVVPRKGSLANLKLEEHEINTLEQNKIRINVKSVGLNFADIFAICGLYSAAPKTPFTPGLEFSGIVLEADSSSPFSIGEKVMGVSRFGGYSTIIDIEPVYCQQIPNGWSFNEAAGYMVQTLTAWYALSELGNIQKNQHVIINSAAGGVGLQALKLCKTLGIEATGLVGNTEKLSFLESQGFTQIFVRDKHLLNKLQNKKTSYHLFLDAVGGPLQKPLFNLLSPMGRMVVFGSANFAPRKNRLQILPAIYNYLKRPLYDPLKLVEHNKSVLGFNLIWLWENIDLLKQLTKELAELKLPPPYVGHTFPFKDAKEALALFNSGKTKGKVVLEVD